MTALNHRQHRLWAALCDRETVTTGDVHAINRRLRAPKRATAKRDVEALRRAGLLVEHGPVNGRWYEPVGVAS